MARALIAQWVRAAMATAVMDEESDDEVVVFDIPALQGCWSFGDTAEKAIANLKLTVRGWVALKLGDGDGDIPVMGGIDINVAHERTISDNLFAQWVRAAMATAVVAEESDDELVIFDIPALQGPYGYGDTAEEAIAYLESVLTEWVALKLADGDTDIPTMGGVDIYASGDQLTSIARTEQWVRAAMASAIVEDEEYEGDDSAIAQIPALVGPWGFGDTAEEAIADLEYFLPFWLVCKLAKGHGDIPVMGGIDMYASQ